MGEVLLLYGQIVAIMNPFTALNNYVTLTENLDSKDAHRIMKVALLVVIMLGFLFIVAGRLILEFYHLSLDALRLGGGVLLMYVAIDMLSGKPKTRTVDAGEIAVVPLATPMIVGPGTMTLLINLGTLRPTFEVLLSFLLAVLTIFIFLRSSGLIVRAIRRSGVRAMARFMALIIASVAAQMILGSLNGFFSGLKMG